MRIVLKCDARELILKSFNEGVQSFCFVFVLNRLVWITAQHFSAPQPGHLGIGVPMKQAT